MLVCFECGATSPQQGEQFHNGHHFRLGSGAWRETLVPCGRLVAGPVKARARAKRLRKGDG